MSAKHTPGPWRYDRITIGHEDNWKNPVVQYEGGYIGRVGWQGSTIRGMSSLTPETLEEAEANARLIAAAPDLLAFVSEVASYSCSCDKQPSRGSKTCWQCRAAALKLKAEPPNA